MQIQRYVSIRSNFFTENLDDFVVAVIYLALFDNDNIVDYNFQ